MRVRKLGEPLQQPREHNRQTDGVLQDERRSARLLTHSSQAELKMIAIPSLAFDRHERQVGRRQSVLHAPNGFGLSQSMWRMLITTGSDKVAFLEL